MRAVRAQDVPAELIADLWDSYQEAIEKCVARIELLGPDNRPENLDVFTEVSVLAGVVSGIEQCSARLLAMLLEHTLTYNGGDC